MHAFDSCVFKPFSCFGALVSFFACLCVCVSSHVFLFFASLVCCVLYELDLVSCLIFGGHLKFMNFKFVNHYFGYLGIYLI